MKTTTSAVEFMGLGKYLNRMYLPSLAADDTISEMRNQTCVDNWRKAFEAKWGELDLIQYEQWGSNAWKADESSEDYNTIRYIAASKKYMADKLDWCNKNTCE